MTRSWRVLVPVALTLVTAALWAVAMTRPPASACTAHSAWHYLVHPDPRSSDQGAVCDPAAADRAWLAAGTTLAVAVLAGGITWNLNVRRFRT